MVRGRHPSNCIRSLSLKPLIWGLWKYETSCSLPLSMGDDNKAEDEAIPLKTHWFITGKDGGGGGVLSSCSAQRPTVQPCCAHSSLGRECEAAQFCKKRQIVQKQSHPAACTAQTSSVLSDIHRLPQAMEALVHWQGSCTVGTVSCLQSRDV